MGSGWRLACRRGRRPASRKIRSELRQLHIDSAGQDARLYGRPEARRYSAGHFRHKARDAITVTEVSVNKIFTHG